MTAESDCPNWADRQVRSHDVPPIIRVVDRAFPTLRAPPRRLRSPDR